MPTGLTFDAATGAFGGTPTEAGTFTISVPVEDRNRFTGSVSYSLTIAAPVITLTGTTLTDGIIAAAYVPYQFLASGNGAGTLSYAISAGTLPAGLSLAPDGTLSGTPTVQGSFSFEVTARDANGFTGAALYELDVLSNVSTTLMLPSTIGNWSFKQTDSRSLAASNATAAARYSISAGILPPGITIDAVTGMLSGTPTSAGTFPFEVTVHDGPHLKSQTYSLVVTPPVLSLPGTPSTTGRVGVAHAANFTASSTLAGSIFTYTLADAPPGLSIDTSGDISGVPTSTGTFTVTVKATDADGFAATSTFTLTIAPAFIPLILPLTLPPAENGIAYSQSLEPSNGTAPYTVVVTPGALPPGLSISANTLSGTPTADSDFTFTVDVTDDLGNTGTRTYTLSVAPAGASLPKSTSTSLTVSPATPAIGQTVTLSAIVSSSAGTPTGFVVFEAGGVILDTVLLDAGGNAEIQVPAAAQNLQAKFLANTDFAGSDSTPVSVSPNAAETELNVNGVLTVSQHDEPVVVVATASRKSPSTGLPSSGTIEIYLNGTLVDTASTTTGTLTFAEVLDPGIYTLRAVYTPDSNALNDPAETEVEIRVEADTHVLITGPASNTEGAVSTFIATVSTVPAHPTIDPTGDVEFMAGSTSLGTQPLVNGEATLVTDQLPAGLHNIWVNYSGHRVFRAFASRPLAHQVVPVIATPQATTTALSLSTSTPVISQVVTLEALVTTNSALVPTGQVDFIDRSTGAIIGTGFLDSTGRTSIDYAVFDLGQRDIDARYLGDGTFDPSDTSASITASSAPTTLTLSASAAQTLMGEPVTLTATVDRQSPATGLPSSAVVEFFADGNLIGTAVTNGTSSADFITAPLTADTVFTARYLGPVTQIDATSQSTPLNHSVVRDSVGMAVDVTANGPDYLISATLTPAVLTGRTPSGTLTLQHTDGLFADKVVTLTGNNAQFTVPAALFTPGLHTLSISYGGDTYFSPNLAQVSHQVLGNTTVSLSMSPSRPVPGQPVAFAARVFSLSSGMVPTGSVLFRFASSTWSHDATGTLSGGLATASITFPDASEGEMTVIYSGDALHQSTAASPLRRRIAMTQALEATSTALSSSAPAIGVGQPVTFSAAVDSASGAPAGSVVFYSGNIFLGRANVAAGIAQYTVPGFASGTHPIIAYYGGTAVHAASQSAPFNQRVLGADGVSFTMTTRPQAFVALGQRIEVVYTLVASGGIDLSGIGVNSASMSVACPATTLAAFASMECIGSYTITEADMLAGRVDLPGTAVIDGIGAIVSGTSITLEAAAVAEQFATMTEEFMTTRQKLVATALRLPDIFDRRRIAPGRRPGTVIARADGTTQVLGFTSSLADVMSWGAAKAAENLATSVALEPLPVNIWIDAQMTLHAQDGVDVHWGDFSTLAVGVDYLLGDTALLGAVIQGDWMRDNSSKGSVSGTGYLAGVYGSVALSEHLSLDASLLYGQSQNEAIAAMFGQYFSGTFDTERLLANINLTGFWENDALTIRPNLLMTLSTEDGGDYLVRNETGDAVLVEIERQTEFKLGLGSAFEYAIDLEGGHVLTPKAELELGLSGSVLGGLSIDSRLYGRSKLGFGFTSEGGLTVNGELGADLDATGFRSVTVRGGIGAKF